MGLAAEAAPASTFRASRTPRGSIRSVSWFCLRVTTKRYRRSVFPAAIGLRRNRRSKRSRGLFLLHAPVRKHSLLMVCGSPELRFVAIADSDGWFATWWARRETVLNDTCLDRRCLD